MSAVRRLAALTAILAAGLLIEAGPASAESPWLQVTTGARPTHLWTPRNEVQEIRRQPELMLIYLESALVACMGGPECTSAYSLPNAETAAELQSSLEAAYGIGAVAVSEDPQAPGHFLVESVGSSAGHYVTPLTVFSKSGATLDAARTRVEGGSGRLAVSVTNLGDAPLDGGQTPLRIADELPAGVAAYHVTATGGNLDRHGPVECSLESQAEVKCTFEGALPSFEAIELEIYVSLTGEPPLPGQLTGQVAVSGANAAAVTEAQPIHVSSEQTPFGVERFAVSAEEEGGGPAVLAATHPFQLTTTLQLNQGQMVPGIRLVEQPAQPRNLRFTLPAGLVGNASRIPKCDAVAFVPHGFTNLCPPETAIGIASATVASGSVGFLHLAVPVFNLQPEPGQPARFGFVAGGVPVTLNPGLKTAQGYQIVVSSDNVSEAAALLSSTVSIWGDPADSRHDGNRGWDCVYYDAEGPCLSPSSPAEVPLLRLPTSCAGPLGFGAALEPWNVPMGSTIATAGSSTPALTGCNHVPFSPSIDVRLDTDRAAAPTGLDVALTLPQPEIRTGVAPSDIRKTKVRLPAQLQINPAGAAGLTACSEDGMGFQRVEPDGEAVFDETAARCPASSKLGTVKIDSPLIDEPILGSVYQAAQGAGNPLGSLIALYIAAEAPGAGVRLKLVGKVEPTPDGLVSTFAETPQAPFEKLELNFFGGSQAPLATGPCGTYTTETEITPWSGNPPATPSSQLTIDHGPKGGPCLAQAPFSPSFSAGTETPIAGAYSPFVVRLEREDGSQQLGSVETVLPPGMTGKLAGVPYCPQSAIERAQSLDQPGDGAVEITTPSCPSDSRVGEVKVGSGTGPKPYVVQGMAYLAGPYDGAPLSMLIVTPAVAGPFDLGSVAVRVRLYVNPLTAQITARSDDLPSQLQGIPLGIRSVSLRVDRPSFTLNPTSCEPMQVTGSLLSLSGGEAGVASPFQVGACRALGFKPRLSLSLKGSRKQLRRSGNPQLTAVLRPRAGDANLASTTVVLPHSEFIDQAHISNPCTRVQYAEGGGGGGCPAKSVIGRVTAYTPLLSKPLAGKVYFRSNGGERELPDIVLSLDGQFHVESVGFIDSRRGRIRSRFASLPDAPLSKVVIDFFGGKRGLLENSVDLCAKEHRARVAMAAHNGRVRVFEPRLRTSCGARR